MKTNITKLPIPLPGLNLMGTISFDNQFESAPTINITAYTTGVIPDILTKGGLFSYNGYNFKLNNSNVTLDPVTNKKIINASFVATSFIGQVIYRPRDGKALTEQQQNPFFINAIGVGSVAVAESDIVKFDLNYAIDDSANWDFEPTVLTWEKEYDAANDGNMFNNKPIFEPIPQPGLTITNDPENAAIPPTMGVIDEFGMNYDLSGPTKTIEINSYSGTVLKTKKVTTYGYTYVSSNPEVAEFVEEKYKFIGLLDSFWGPVEEFTINYNYDGSGYYLGYDKTGSKLVRYAQESDFDAFRLTFESSPNLDDASFFEFFWTPIIEYERLELSAYYNYYPDARPTESDVFVTYEDYNRQTDSMELKYEKNLEYTVPLFTERQLTYSRCYSYRFVPEDSIFYKDIENQIVSTGQENKSYSWVNIRVGNDVTEDFYETLTETVSSQDSEFENHIKQSDFQFNFGRPGQADYIPLYRIKVEENLDESIPKIQNQYVAYYRSSYKEARGSTNFPDANNAQSALVILKEQLRKSMLFSGDSFTLTCLYKPTVKPNNLLTCSYKGSSYKGIVQSVQHTFEIVGKDQAKGYTTITVGIQNNKNNMWSQIKLDVNRSKNPRSPSPGLPAPSRLGSVADVTTLVESLPKRSART